MTPTPPPPPRRATVADRDAVVATVAAAFVDDPAWLFFTGGRPGLAERFAGTLFDSRAVGGQVWLANDAAGVAMWDEPRDPHRPHTADPHLWDPYRDAAGPDGWARLQAYDAALASRHPTGPFWYLGVLATHPDRRGEGLAVRALEPVLAQADADGLPCCLETSKTRNLEFYRRRGFTESTPVPLVDGPPTWWLTRPAR